MATEQETIATLNLNINICKKALEDVIKIEINKYIGQDSYESRGEGGKKNVDVNDFIDSYTKNPDVFSKKQKEIFKSEIFQQAIKTYQAMNRLQEALKKEKPLQNFCNEFYKPETKNDLKPNLNLGWQRAKTKLGYLVSNITKKFKGLSQHSESYTKDAKIFQDRQSVSSALKTFSKVSSEKLSDEKIRPKRG